MANGHQPSYNWIMRSRIGYLLLGAALGLVIAKTVTHENNKPVQPEIRALPIYRPAPQQLVEQIVEARPHSLQKPIEPPLRPAAQPPDQNAVRTLPSINEADRFFTLSLSEAAIQELESDIQLRDYHAYTVPLDEGWEIQIQKESSPFVRMGLRSGDLVTHSSLEAKLGDVQQYSLAVRMIAVLRALERR